MGSQAPEVWQLYEGFGFVLALFLVFFNVSNPRRFTGKFKNMIGGSKVIFGILENQRRKIRITPHCGIIKVTNMFIGNIGGWGEGWSWGFFRFRSLSILSLCYFLKLVSDY